MNVSWIRNPKIEAHEVELGYEPAFCGNPWKLFKKIYREGLEVKQVKFS